MMKLFIPILFFCFGTAYSQTNCDKYSKRYTPKDLNEALAYLTCTWTANDKENFKAQTEQEGVASLHFGTGLSIRNSWGLWKGKNALVKYFNSIGIFHPDDISSIILTSFHRQLNDKDINLKNQVQYYKDYWNNVQTQKAEHQVAYTSIKIGDTVNVVFSKQKASTDNYSLAFISHTASINDTTHCFVKGIIVEKDKKKNSQALTIQIITTINCDNSFLGNIPMTTGQKFNYDMTYFYLRRD